MADQASAKNANFYEGSLIRPQENSEVSGESPVDLLDSAIQAFRNYEKILLDLFLPQRRA